MKEQERSAHVVVPGDHGLCLAAGVRRGARDGDQVHWRVLLNHVIRLQQQRWGDRKTERFGGFEIDYQLKLRGLLHGDVGGLGALENLVDEGRRPTIDVGIVPP